MLSVRHLPISARVKLFILFNNPVTELDVAEMEELELNPSSQLPLPFFLLFYHTALLLGVTLSWSHTWR